MTNHSSCATRAKPQELTDKWCQDLHSVEKSEREILLGEEHGAELWGCKPAARLGNTCRALSLPGHGLEETVCYKHVNTHTLLGKKSYSGRYIWEEKKKNFQTKGARLNI